MELLAHNIAKYREERGLTIIGMSERCGIAKSTLSVIENGKGNPTIETLWAIANTLDVPFGHLISDHSEKNLQTNATLSETGSTVRLIEHTNKEPEIEVYSVDYAAGYRHESPAHPIGVKENITVISGALLVGAPETPKLVRAGETYSFSADIPHVYASFNQDAKAIILIEYPPKESLNSLSIIHLDWPSTCNDWDGAWAVIERLLIEVSQGIKTRQLQFNKCKVSVDNALVELRHLLDKHTSSSFNWPVLTILDAIEQTPYLVILPLRVVSAFPSFPQKKKSVVTSLSTKATRLARLAESPFKYLARFDDLQNDVASDSWVISALASEVLIQRGQMVLPAKFSGMTEKHLEQQSCSDERTFSSRINVDHYDAFELVHPAYARQVVAVAEDLTEFLSNKKTSLIIDVGTGPGIPLLMLNELHPTHQFKAIEPDARAFACLQQNIKNIRNIEAEKIDFLDIEVQSNTVPVITSFGASHHSNTAFMLQKAMMLLEPGGLLCVADEFLPEFNSSDERNLALIKHHSAYILTAIAWINNTQSDTLIQLETELYMQIRQTLTISLIEAESGFGPQAINRCRKLYIDIKKRNFPNKPEHILSVYSRFFWLEIQAMIAGFDYEVERKTYPGRFLELTNLAGFQLLRHRRIFATTGSNDLDGGTHVFTLQKPVDFLNKE